MITIKRVLRLAAVAVAAASMSGVAAQAATFKLKIGAGPWPADLLHSSFAHDLSGSPEALPTRIKLGQALPQSCCGAVRAPRA